MTITRIVLQFLDMGFDRFKTFCTDLLDLQIMHNAIFIPLHNNASGHVHSHFLNIHHFRELLKNPLHIGHFSYPHWK